jgi:hypothetical protein
VLAGTLEGCVTGRPVMKNGAPGFWLSALRWIVSSPDVISTMSDASQPWQMMARVHGSDTRRRQR